MGIHERTLHRYLSGEAEIPRLVELVARCWLKRGGAMNDSGRLDFLEKESFKLETKLGSSTPCILTVYSGDARRSSGEVRYGRPSTKRYLQATNGRSDPIKSKIIVKGPALRSRGHVATRDPCAA